MGLALQVYSRLDLVDQGLSAQTHAVLLEGAWPPEAAAPNRWSLDVSVGREFLWIDQQAEAMAEALAACGNAPSLEAPFNAVSAAYLNALELRYYLLKLTRVVAFFTDVRPLGSAEAVELTAAAGRDEDYAALLEQLCRRAGIACRAQWVDGPRGRGSAFPPNSILRRTLSAVAQRLEPKLSRSDRRPRIVLCGNPRLLDPLCAALLAAGVRVWWLYDRFAVGTFARWRPWGAGQLVCDASQGRTNRLIAQVPSRLECCGVDLMPIVNAWLQRTVAAKGVQQTRLVERIDEHFSRVMPDVLLLDEDATPMKRAAVALGRAHGVTSMVIQHGAPCARFGFAPLAADRICVWGQAAQEQLVRWGIDPQRILVTGSPLHDRLRRRLTRLPRPAPGSQRDSRPHLLLLATVPPRDDRPDLIGIHFTTQTYAEMLRVSLAGAERVGARLTIKVHPRTASDPILDRVLQGFPGVDVQVARRGRLEDMLGSADCLLSMGSSGGVDATLSGIPVIQVLPPGVDDLLPCDRWSLLGTAGTDEQLVALLQKALAARGTRMPEVGPAVFGDFSQPAAQRIVDEVFAAVRRSGDSRPGRQET